MDTSDLADEPRYQVVVDGTLTGEFDKRTTCLNLQRQLNLSKLRADRMLGSGEQVVKSDLSENQALAILIRLAEAGCEAFLVEITPTSERYQQQRRVNGERRMRHRRDARLSVIVPDRRLHIRRAVDIRQFRQLVRDGKTIPVQFRAYSPNSVK